LFDVQISRLGSGMWISPLLPLSYQAAVGLSRVTSDRPFVEDVRIVPSAGSSRALDISV